MVQFDFDRPASAKNWTVTLHTQDAHDYVATLKGLLYLLGTQPEDTYSHNDIKQVLLLVEAMIPEPEQLVC